MENEEQTESLKFALTQGKTPQVAGYPNQAGWVFRTKFQPNPL